MTHRPFFPPTVFLILAAACTAAPDREVIVHLPAATILVEDPDLHGVKDLRPTESGELVVLSRYSPYLRWYDREGRLICVGGHAGDGPGEFRYPWAFVRHAPAPVVSDPNLRRLTTIPGCREEPSLLRFPDVVPDARRDLPDLTYGDPYQVAYAAGGYFTTSFPAPITLASGFLPATIVRVSGGGVLGDTVVSFRTVPGREEVVRAAQWLLPIPTWDACPNGELVTHDGIAGHLKVLGHSPAGDRLIALPGYLSQRRELSVEEVRLHVRHTLILEYLSFQDDTLEVDARADEVLRLARSWFGHTAPALTRILCDDRSRIWLQEFDLHDAPTGMSARWTVIDGEARRRVRFPTEFRVLDIRADRAYGVVIDRFGEETLAAVPIRW